MNIKSIAATLSILLLVSCSTVKPITNLETLNGNKVSVILDTTLLKEPEKLPNIDKSKLTPAELLEFHKLEALVVGSLRSQVTALQQFVCKAFPENCK